MYTLQQIADITQSEFIGEHNNLVVHFLNDSRGLQSAADTLFIAIKTKRNNGHDYIESLINRGVRSFLVKQGEVNPKHFNGVSFLVSNDPLKSIQRLASVHRTKFQIPVIGITGSNGKTVVKEWLYQALKDRYTICRSPKSFNSQIGVPLSVLNLNKEHSLAIFEAGISQANEMQNLADIIQPTIGVFTSLGSAHDEGFKSSAHKVSEKFLLFSSCSKIIVNGLSETQIPKTYEDRVLIVDSDTLSNFKIPFQDEASIQNACTCVEVLKQFKFSVKEIAEKALNLQPVALRLEIKNGINNSLLINDYYNSDLDSLRIALNFMQQQSRRSKKVLIVSDIEQSGIPSTRLYKILSELFSSNKIDLLIGIGSEISKNRTLFKAGSLFFEDTQKFIGNFRSFDFQLHNCTILLKGARSFGFENISRILQQKSHDTVFEINLNRLTDNINYFRSQIDNQTMLMCMVKAMAYGSGSAEIARTLAHIGVNYLAVAYADEGVELRNAHISLPIMVMNPEEEAFDDIINFQLEPEIYSFRVLRAFVNKLELLGITQPYPVHIKLDTGMRRLGFESSEVEELATLLKTIPNIMVKSVFSHLAASDNPLLDSFTEQQITVFKKDVATLEEALSYTVIKHICNSAAISRFKKAHFNMVRLGIGMYGIGVDASEQHKLQNVGVLKTRISQIKSVTIEQTVGYNRSGKLTRDSKIAIIPIGYADGFSRMLSNGAHGVYVRGNFCKIVGNVCMDMCMIDVTDVTCEEGDEVIVFENSEQINALAKSLKSIPYEVLTNVSGRVKRIYIQE